MTLQGAFGLGVVVGLLLFGAGMAAQRPPLRVIDDSPRPTGFMGITIADDVALKVAWDPTGQAQVLRVDAEGYVLARCQP